MRKQQLFGCRHKTRLMGVTLLFIDRQARREAQVHDHIPQALVGRVARARGPDAGGGIEGIGYR